MSDTRARNETIKTRRAAGESLVSLAKEYGISKQRIGQITGPKPRRHVKIEIRTAE